ncbi:MAG: ribonuclease G [Halioglobus sp.]|nr:ribonuclease G [Halioglobus sp.]
MSEEILINFTPMETRVALVDNGAAQDIHIERAATRGIVGNIYAAKVVRVLPGMQAAFVDIGVERTAFLHVSDIVVAQQQNRSDRNRPSDNIADLLHEGKKLVVQVVKDPLGSKGARVTTELSVSTRYLVMLAQSGHIGVSQLIEDPVERTRLQQVLAQCLAAQPMAEPRGFILRTAAEGVGENEIAADLRFLDRLWSAVARRAAAATGTELLYEELPLYLRIVRDMVRPSVERIQVDSRECFAALQAFCADYVPEVAPLLELYSGERPLFELHAVEDEIQRALEARVELKSGGHLIIDQTEAMTTIDVNTGSFVGRRNQAETILKTNLEAAAALARQLRVRNLGGIIIVDFIDMDDAEHRRQVHRTLEKHLQRDPARCQISGISDLGLVEMTRKRTRESLQRMLCEGCPVCRGRGMVKTAETVCYEIFREIMRDARAYENDSLMVLASQAVVDRLLDEESAHLADLAEFIGKPISLRAEPGYNQEQFDIILL